MKNNPKNSHKTLKILGTDDIQEGQNTPLHIKRQNSTPRMSSDEVGKVCDQKS